MKAKLQMVNSSLLVVSVSYDFKDFSTFFDFGLEIMVERAVEEGILIVASHRMS